MKFLISGADNNDPGVTVPTFNFIAASNKSLWNTTQTNRDTIVPAAQTLLGMVVRVLTAPGTGKSRTFAVYKNGAATALSVTISDTNTQATISGASVSFSAGDTISFAQTAVGGSPNSTTGVYWSILAESVTTDYFNVFGGSATTNGVTAYQPLQSGTGAWETSAAGAEQIIPLAGSITSLYVASTVNPGTGTDAWDVAVMVNGTASAATVHYGAAENGVKSWSGSVAISAGDRLALRFLETATSAASAFAWSAAIAPTTAGEFCQMFGSSAAPSTSEITYEQMLGGGTASWSIVESSYYSTLHNATLQAIYAKVGTAPGGAASRTFTVRDELADTSAAVTISGASTTGNASFSVATTAGNRYSIKATPASTPAAMTGGAHIGLKFSIIEAGAELDADATAIAAASGALTTAIQAAANATATATASGALTTAINMAASAAASATSTSDLSAAITLATDASSVASAAGDLSTAIQLAAAAVSAASATGALATPGAELAASAQASATASAALSTAVQMAAAATAQAGASGGLTTQIPLSATMVAEASGSGALSTAINMQASAVAVAAGSGAIIAQITLSGAALAEAIAAGSLATGTPLLGAASAVAGAPASLTAQVTLSGAALAQALSTGDLSGGGGSAALAAAATAQASASGSLLTGVPVIASAASVASASGDLSAQVQLAGVAASVMSATGDLTATIQFDAVALAEAFGSGALTTETLLAGDAAGLASASGSLTTTIILSADALAQAVASATLFENYPATVLARWTVAAHARNWDNTAMHREWGIAAIRRDRTNEAKHRGWEHIAIMRDWRVTGS